MYVAQVTCQSHDILGSSTSITRHPIPHVVMFAEDDAILHCSLLQLWVHVVAIVTNNGLDPGQAG